MNNVTDIWSILKKEIEDQGPGGSGGGCMGRSSSSEQQVVRRDPDAEQMKAVLEEMERKGDLYIPGVDDKEKISYVDPIVDKGDPHGAEEDGSEKKETEEKGTGKDSEKGEKTMKKSIRIRQNGDQVNVRVFVGEEEFCGMSVANGSNNSISLGNTTVSIQGDETILEI